MGRNLQIMCGLATLTTACSDGDRGTGELSASGASVTVTGITAVTLTGGDPTDSDATGGQASSDTGAGEGGTDCTSDSECLPGQHCSAASGVCVNAGGCLFDEDCEPGFECAPGGTCQIGGCGAESFDLTAVPPNVMIVLDRSGSMDGDVQDSSKTRWEVAKDAIGQLVAGFDDEIRFGLDTYSSCTDKECSAGSIVVPIGNKNAAPITGFLAGKDLDYLCNSGNPETSTGNTLYALIGEDSLQDPQRSNAVLLITDGGENGECKTVTDGAMAAGKLLSQPLSVKTFVVGFSDEVIDSLAGIAEAGGTQTAFNANNPASLEAALTAIAGAVASCQFLLDSVPEDIAKIYVFFDDDPAGVPIDAVDGWTYDPITNTVTFHGSACAAIQLGTVQDVDVVFGCNIPVPG